MPYGAFDVFVTDLREAIGSAEPSPDDRLREDEMAVVPFLELQVGASFRPSSAPRAAFSSGVVRISVTVALCW